MNGINAVSLFAGIEGFGLALDRCGIPVVAAVEKDPDCRGVIARHFPQTRLFNDVTEVTGDQLRAAGFVPERGIITAGWPCQGNSVAGNRGGMADPRSGLWRHVVRLLAETRPRWFIGENVPGLLSVNGGDDLAVVRRDLAQLGYWWAERVLDSQYFGVPQRRRRLFFVGCPGDRESPVEVLLEPEGRAGNHPSRGKARADIAGTLGSRAGGSRTTDLDGHGAYVTEPLAPTITAGWGTNHGAPGHGGKDDAVLAVTAATLQGGGRRGHRIDAEGAAGGHLIPFDTAQITSGENRSNPKAGDPAPTLNGTGATWTRPVPLSVGADRISAALTARQAKGPDSDATSGFIVTHALTSGGADASEDGTGRGIVTSGVPRPVPSSLAVRRLTPKECERLQDFPDDWTRWKLAGGELVEQSDSARYRQVGNAVSVCVPQWIVRRLVAVEQARSAESGAA